MGPQNLARRRLGAKTEEMRLTHDKKMKFVGALHPGTFPLVQKRASGLSKKQDLWSDISGIPYVVVIKCDDDSHAFLVKAAMAVGNVRRYIL